MKTFLLILILILCSCGSKKSNEIFTSSYNSDVSVNDEIPGTGIKIQFPISRFGLSWNQYYSFDIVNLLSTSPYNTILDKSLSPVDLSRLGCPNYNLASTSEKIGFWVIYLSTISNIESGYNNNLFIFDPAHNKSSGLLMISSSEANKEISDLTLKSYTMKSLMSSHNNIEAGIALLFKQLTSSSNGQMNSKLFFFNERLNREFIGQWLRTDSSLFLTYFEPLSAQLSFCRGL